MNMQVMNSKAPGGFRPLTADEIMAVSGGNDGEGGEGEEIVVTAPRERVISSVSFIPSSWYGGGDLSDFDLSRIGVGDPFTLDLGITAGNDQDGDGIEDEFDLTPFGAPNPPVEPARDLTAPPPLGGSQLPSLGEDPSINIVGITNEFSVGTTGPILSPNGAVIGVTIQY